MYGERMNRILIAILILTIFFLNLLVSVHAGLTVAEGSLELKAMEKKKVCGIACVFSVYENPSTYRLDISGNIGKFVNGIEPNTFTLTGINCPGEPEQRRACITNLCNNPNSTSTKMPCIYFSGPLKISFDTCNGIPCNPQMQKYEGSIRVIGSIGAAQTVEPLSFIIYYTPISGWLLLAGGVILAMIIIFLVYITIKRRKKIAMFCEKCSKKYKKSIKFCPHCGSSLVEK
jgi:hypothetical protein